MLIHFSICSYIDEAYINLSITNKVLDELFNTLWFLKSLFICYIIYFIISLSKKWIRFMLLLLLVIPLPFLSWFHLKLMIPSFLIGVLVKRYFESISSWGMLLLSGSSFVLCLVFLWNADYFLNPPRVFKSLIEGDLTPMSMLLYRYIISLVTGVSGSIFFIILFRFSFNSNKRHIMAISKYGQYTLGIYILQTILLETILPHYLLFDGNRIVTNVIIIPIISFAILFICIVLNKVLMCNYIFNEYFLGKV